MASCDLRLAFADGRTTFSPGDVVEGEVIVQIDGPVRCDGLDVHFEWFTHGKGNDDDGPVAEKQRLYAGEWTAGTLRYPFRFTAPATPLAYSGELLNVDFRVRATADIPWAFDPSTFEIVEVVHTPPPSGLAISWEPEKYATNGHGGCLALSTVLLLMGGAVLAAAVSSGRDYAGLAALLFIFGFLGFAGSLRRYLSEKELGKVKLEIGQAQADGYRQAGAGDQLVVAAMVRADAEVNGATMTLEVLEKVVRGSGTNKSTYTHEIYEAKGTLEPVSPGRLQGTLKLPYETAPYSFYADDNELRWVLQVRIDLPGTLDWIETVQLTASPGPR